MFHDDSFCAWCGTAILTRPPVEGPSRQDANATISPAERETCGSCNSPVLPADLFCANCGARCADEDPEAGFAESTTTIARRVTEAADGRYEFIRPLGRGGMGIVLMARDLDLGRLVAIKVLAPSWLTDSSMVTRFQHEARTIASLRHESIVSVYDVGRAGDFYYFVMDFIEGVSLGEIIRTQGTLPVPAVEAVLYQVGSALDYAHGRSNTIVHRDIKPANIMLDAEGLAVLMDFGISKASGVSSGLTRTGVVMGTPEYMSPEQCRGPTVTHASDQYSLGAVVFAMLTGAPPFTGPYYRVLLAHQSEPVPDLLEIRPDCPPELAKAVERSLAKLPSERFPTIGDMLHELDLRPLPRGSPARVQIGELVRDTQEAAERDAAASTGGRRAASSGERTPTSLRIVPHPEELEVGEKVGLSAVVQFPDGIEERGFDVAWESTDPSIVRVDPDTGRLVAVRAGSAMVKAVGGGVSDLLSISVSPPKVVRVSITPESPEIEVGSRLQLHAWPTSKTGQTLEEPVSWSSSDPRSASVTDDGKVTAHRPGSVSILAHCAGVGGSTPIHIVPEGEGGIRTIEDQATHMIPGTFGTDPDATVLGGTPPGGRPAASGAGLGGDQPPSQGPGGGQEGATRVDSPGAGPTAPDGSPAQYPGSPAGEKPGWLRPAAGAAVVLLAGLLWFGWGALAGGADVVELRITADGEPAGTAPLPLVEGETLELDAAAYDGEGRLVESPEVAWASLDPSIATVSGGRVVGVGEGTVGVRAAVGGVEASATIEVRSVLAADEEESGAVASIRVRNADTGGDVQSLRMEPGVPVRLEGLPMDADGGPVPGTQVEWSSTTPGLVAVDSRGFVTGIRAGSAEVVASAGDVEERIPVTITAPRVAEPPAASEPARAPDPGVLQLQVRPWADVWVDDRREADEQQTFTMELSAGRHRLRLTNPNFPQFDTTFTIRSGRTTTLQIRLNRNVP